MLNLVAGDLLQNARRVVFQQLRYAKTLRGPKKELAGVSQAFNGVTKMLGPVPRGSKAQSGNCLANVGHRNISPSSAHYFPSWYC